MASGNFTFVHEAKQPKQQQCRYLAENDNPLINKNVLSSHSTKPADNCIDQDQNRPRSTIGNSSADGSVEIIDVTWPTISSHDARGDSNGSPLSSDSETDYEIVDSNYIERFCRS